ncbi:MAG: flavin reductase family protein [Planctomycetota bacterium]|jgi:flavin reductase (DIM6/NTAB) family NADH-FMN oxidoreductase RutF
MSKVKIDPFDAVAETMAALGSRGALLVAGAEPVNPMTIGWGQIGIAWGKPVFLVMVRPSRFTFGLMAKATAFSVNVPGDDLAKACALCGTKSGRDTDKIAEAGLAVERGTVLDVPTLAGCPIHYECRILEKSMIDPATLDGDVEKSCYPSGDHHAVWWGEIAGAFRRA